MGLISDTHGFLDDSVYEHFGECDEIWHAGDIGDVTIADELAMFKPLRAVYGNIDGREVRASYPLRQDFVCEGMRVWIQHIVGRPGKYTASLSQELEKTAPDILMAGHSHILRVMQVKKFNLLHLNPGAAGNYGIHHVRTLLRLTLHKKKIEKLVAIRVGKPVRMM